MKIIALHGEDIGKSYQRLEKFTSEARNRNWEILSEISLTPSLFGKERLIVVRDYKLLTKKILEAFKKADGTLVVYHESILPKTFLQILPEGSTIEEFKLPKLIWSFLENLIPGNSEKSVQTLHKIIERDAPEFAFTLIARQFRDLYWLKADPKTFPYPPWRASKLKIQSDKFSGESLKKIIENLSGIDIKVKTSKAEIVSSLDLLLLKQLELP